MTKLQSECILYSRQTYIILRIRIAFYMYSVCVIILYTKSEHVIDIIDNFMLPKIN